MPIDDMLKSRNTPGLRNRVHEIGANLLLGPVVNAVRLRAKAKNAAPIAPTTQPNPRRKNPRAIDAHKRDPLKDNPFR
jgi:hypothetical protein